METNAQHTPWSMLWRCLIDEEGVHVATFESFEHATAAGPYILRAVNAHADLVEALKRIEARSHDAIHSVTEARQCVRQFRDIARAALAKAKVE